MVESIPRKPCWVETRATRDWSDVAGALGMVGGGRVGWKWREEIREVMEAKPL